MVAVVVVAVVVVAVVVAGWRQVLILVLVLGGLIAGRRIRR